ncbi:MAG: hypothetical protein M2R45_00483 [Verrucomicrobia subdivision 3 bacterium]|nr:hypothetical protein [Limisphaerales bacterium]MCS1413639.1 hypothetical protein [Limisphaerales bacterium]
MNTNIITRNKALFAGFILFLVACLIASAAIPAIGATVGWARTGQWAWRIISGAGTMVTFGQLLNEINKPNDTEAGLRARPSVYDNPTRRASGAYRGITWETRRDLQLGKMGGNYAVMDAEYIAIVWDEELEDYRRGKWTLTINAPHWMSKKQWDDVYANPDSAVPNHAWYEFWDRAWSKGGYWLTSGGSYQYEYPPVKVESDVWNPAWFGTVLDGELVGAARKLDLTYKARLHFQTQKLTWVNRPNGNGSWKGGTWVKNDLKKPKFTITFPGYEDASKSGIDICPPNHKIRSVHVKGGMDIWWHKNVEHIRAVLETQPLDDQGNLTGDVTRHDRKLQKNVYWVVDYSRQPN